MSAENNEQDKSEEASPYKLEQARKKGQVAKSMEINSLVTLTIFTLLMLGLFGWISQSISEHFKRLLSSSGSLLVDTNTSLSVFMDSVVLIFTVFSPIIIALVLGSVIVSMIQTKPIFTTEPLKPKFDKLNPVSGAKKIFSIKSLFELVKTLLKLAAIGSFIFYGLKTLILELVSSKYLAQQQVASFWMEKVFWSSLILILILVPFAVIDFIFTKRQFSKKMRMSKREVKEEVKKRDGDPDVRAKRKKIQNELLKKTASISDVKNSDVIITNPTHYSVALKYSPGQMIAPIVIAKGRDILADKIKRKGLEYNVPIFRQPKLTRKIYKETDISQPIQESNYTEIAPIFRWVFRTKGKTF
jgi:flagellar biosynthesis protein FlhB